NEAGAKFALECPVSKVERLDPPAADGARFRLETKQGELTCESLVIATGGLSIPKVGATGFGYELARQFGLKMVETSAALDGLVFADKETQTLRELAGISIDCTIECNGVAFRENILFTHSGLSGPAALQASLHWYKGDEVTIDLLPGQDTFAWFLR